MPVVVISDSVDSVLDADKVLSVVFLPECVVVVVVVESNAVSVVPEYDSSVVSVDVAELVGIPATELKPCVEASAIFVTEASFVVSGVSVDCDDKVS